MSSDSQPASTSTRGQRSRSITSPFINSSPEYLNYPPPFNGRCIQNTLLLYNTSEHECVYKLRSQRPERYVAKPNVAVVAPNTAVRILVTLHAGGAGATAATQDRFRLSVKLLAAAPPGCERKPKAHWYRGKSPRTVWDSCPDAVCHERDIAVYFRADMDTPPGGMITFHPATYLESTAAAASTAAVTPQSTAKEGSRGDGAEEEDLSAAAVARPLDGELSAAHTGNDNNNNSSSSSREGAERVKRRNWRVFVATTVSMIGLSYVVGVLCRMYSFKGDGK